MTTAASWLSGCASRRLDTTAIRQDLAGELWIARFGAGLSRLATDAAGGRQLVHYRHDDRDPRGLSSEKLLALHVDRSGILWIASKEGLDVFDRRRERFTVYDRGTEGMAGHLEDREGRLWVGGVKPLQRFVRVPGRDAGVYDYLIKDVDLEFLGRLPRLVQSAIDTAAGMN